MAFEIEDSNLMQPMRGNVYISFLAWALRKNARKKIAPSVVWHSLNCPNVRKDRVLLTDCAQ